MRLKHKQNSKTKFGSIEVEAFYYNCLKTINEIDVGYFYKVVTKHNFTEIIICNMFKLRIDKYNVSYHKYLFKSKRWQNIKYSSKCAFNNFVINNLYLIENTSTLYKRFLKDAVLEILYRKKSEYVEKNNQLSFEKIKYIVLAKLLKKAAKPNAHLLGKSFMCMLWNTIIDKTVYSYCLRIYLKPPTLEQYFNIAKMDYPSLCRIGQENPNLLPLLTFFQPDDIKHLDLFSKKRWVISQQVFDISIAIPIQFHTKASWSFFKQLSSRLVKNFLYKARDIPNKEHALWVIDTLMIIRNIKNQKVYIIYFMMNFLFSLLFGRENLCYQINENQRFVFINAVFDKILLIRNRLTSTIFRNLFIYRNMTNEIDQYCDGEYYMFNYQVRDILDYLVANQNIYIRKNKTFDGILSDAQQWEQNIAMKKNHKLMNNTWRKLLPDDKVIKDHLVKELNNGLEVYFEGKEMHHCIQTYIDAASKNLYKIFSIYPTKDLTNINERATLGVVFNLNNKMWELDQVRGVCNKNVPEQILLVSDEVVAILNKNQNG